MRTSAGIILGTAAYMSPEQAKGKPVDKRTDIWAFGCVLYEMLTGTRAFEGEDVTDTLAAIVRGEPDSATLPADTPPPIRRLLRRCLEKDPKRRLQAIGEARIQIEEVLDGEAEESASIAISQRAPRWAVNGSGPKRLVWIATGLALTGLLPLLFVVVPRLREPSTDTRPIRFTIARPQRVTWTLGSSGSNDVVVSPDGSRVAFVVAGQDNRRRLWVHSLESLAAQTLPGTENAYSPFWSPDARYLAFFADGKLKRIELAGAATPQTISAFPDSIGGTWNAAGVILLGSPRGLATVKLGRDLTRQVYPEIDQLDRR